MLKPLFPDALKTCRIGFGIFVEQGENYACQRVFFKCVRLCAVHGDRQEAADACARFKECAHRKSVCLERGLYLPCHCVYYKSRGVKCGQYRCLDAVNGGVAPLGFVGWETAEDGQQSVCRFLHALRDWLFSADVQHLFDTSEARIEQHCFFLRLGSLSLLREDGQCGFYRFDIILK